MIVVVPNYRLGAFGFLASQELKDEGSLNPGLLDVIAAFEWTRKHIAAFGGDPNQITATGLSSGAVIITCLLFAQDGNMELFDRAFLMSGASFPIVETVKSIPYIHEDLSKRANCLLGASNLDCLRALNSTELLKFSIETDYSMNAPITAAYGPIMDGVFITRQHFDSMERKLFRKIPLMLNTNQDEGKSRFT